VGAAAAVLYRVIVVAIPVVINLDRIFVSVLVLVVRKHLGLALLAAASAASAGYELCDLLRQQVLIMLPAHTHRTPQKLSAHENATATALLYSF
jgi:hypothetical protein